MEDTVRGFTFLLNILVVFTQDISPNIYCNKKQQTWLKALNECSKAQGTLVPHEAVFDHSEADINFKSEEDVWTADYAWNTNYTNNRVCGFHYTTKDILYSQVIYGDCNTKRLSLCKNSSGDFWNKMCLVHLLPDRSHSFLAMKLDVYNSSRDNVHCPEKISAGDLQQHGQDIIPGFYWTIDIIYLLKGPAMEGTSQFIPDFCGAYSPPIGKYYVSCTTKRSSLCRLNTNRSIPPFDKSCFAYEPSISTLKTASYGSQSTPRSLNTTVQSTVTFVVGKVEQHKGNDTNLGVTIGLPIGLCLVLICGIILSIYVLRRYKCWKTQSKKSGPQEVIARNNVVSTRQDLARFAKNNGNSADNIFDQTGTNKEPTRNKAPFPEYAVVHKNNLKHMPQELKENWSAKGMENSAVNNSELEENNSYYYVKLDRTVNLNQLAGLNAIQTSEYSFAKEIIDSMDDSEDDGKTVNENEYDVTNNIPSNKTPNNIYNKLQKGGNYSATNVRMGGDSRNQEAESVYDSATQSCQSRPTDNIYNHVSQDETYSVV